MALSTRPRPGRRSDSTGQLTATAGWFESLDRLFPIPPDYRLQDVDRAAALQMLGCGDALLGELMERGLPFSGDRGAELFDRHDLFNLALYSGSGRSVPERALQFALRWMAAPSETLLQRRQWSFSVALTCVEPGGCGADSRWWLARPDAELYGGKTLELSTQPRARFVADSLECQEVSDFTVSARVEISGERTPLRSSCLRDIVTEFAAYDLRWVKAPPELQRRPDALLSHGVATCVSAALHLQRLCRDAGYQARTRRGWVLGMLDLVHAWLEVEDEDGRTKVVDPIFILLSQQVAAAEQNLRELCMGTRINRLLPTGCEGDEPLERHACGVGESRLTKRTTILPARVQKRARAQAGESAN